MKVTRPDPITALGIEKLNELKAVLRMKGQRPEPTYEEIAGDFGVSTKSVKKVEAAMLADDDKRATDPVEHNRSLMISQMQHAIANGEKLDGLFGQISREELGAMLAGITRMMFNDIGSKDGLGSPTLLLRYIKEYGLFANYYTDQGSKGDARTADEMSDIELARIEQETREHLEGIETARRERSEKGFLTKYGSDVLEAEVEEVGSLGEEAGG